MLGLLVAMSMQSALAVAPISCGGEAGTAFDIQQDGGGRFVTATHVTMAGACKRGGLPLRVLDQQRGTDYSSGRSGAVGGLRVSCAGVVAGQQYRLMGYPAGSDELVVVYARATGQVHNVDYGDQQVDGLVSFRGLATRGMSGGPVLDSDGAVVAVISSVSPSTRLTLAQPLSNTGLCR